MELANFIGGVAREFFFVAAAVAALFALVRARGRLQKLKSENLILRSLRRDGARAESDLTAIIESNFIGVIKVDSKDRVIFANPCFLRMIGAGNDSVTGSDLHWRAITAPESWRIGEQTLALLRQGQPVPPVEGNFIRRDGVRVPVLVGATLAGPNGVVIAFVLDLSETKRIEDELTLAKRRAESADRAKTRFLANMSHEIRTPLSAIMGYAELLLDRKQPETAKVHCVETIIRNGQQLTRIINDILDLSKIESDSFAIHQADSSLQDMLQDVQSMLDLQARAKGLQLILDGVTNLPRCVRSDQIRVKQILVNLVSNAVKFTERGTVAITVSVDPPDPLSGAKVRLVFEVADTGIGIDAAHRGHLFQAFEQVDPSVARKFGGTGLGLYLARKLALGLGGDIELVRSQKGQGSVFRATIEAERVGTDVFALSSCRPVEQPPFGGVKPGSLKGSKLEGLRILVVDDSLDLQLLVQRILMSNGARVECAADGVEGSRRALEGGAMSS